MCIPRETWWITRVSCVYLTWNMVHHTCIMCVSHVYHVCISRESWCITRVSCVHPTCIMCVSHVKHGASHVNHVCIPRESWCITRESWCMTRALHIHHTCTSHKNDGEVKKSNLIHWRCILVKNMMSQIAAYSQVWPLWRFFYLLFMTNEYHE